VAHLLRHLAAKQELESRLPSEEESKGELEARRIHGYSKCQVLIVVPFKGDANAVIAEIVRQSKLRVLNEEKYDEEFGDEEKFFQDDFRIGLRVSKKAVKLYSSFDQSDVIVASSLGLRLAIGTKGTKARDCGFLSSIEVLVLYRAQALNQQNFQHLIEVLEAVN